MIKQVLPSLFEKDRLTELKKRSKAAKKTNETIAFILCGGKLKTIIHPNYNPDILYKSILSVPSCFDNDTIESMRNWLYNPNNPSVLLTRNSDNNTIIMQPLCNNFTALIKQFDTNNILHLNTIYNILISSYFFNLAE